jgi:hypothetical protein
MNTEKDWTVYRTRFLVCARQLTEPLSFTDALGREHAGEPGDYLVESSEGCFRITPRKIFEDIYVPLHAPPSSEVGANPFGTAFHRPTNRDDSTAYSCRDVFAPAVRATA